MKTSSNRRNFLKTGSGALGGAFLLAPASKLLGATCGFTPSQTAGPFYPGESRFQRDTDLTAIPGHSSRAIGQVIYVQGKIQDAECNPIENANVEIWQACASGKYNHPQDPNPARLDPHFKYWAETYTNGQGEYGFKTILPGSYPASATWTRPPHIHFKVSCLGYWDLVTQLYFRGQALNREDRILQQIAVGERDSVIVDFQPAPSDLEPGSLIGQFNITLRRVD